jgi:tol-pal system protein YbgF
MKRTVHHTLIAACMGCCLTWPVFAMAPVVDESENFALFDEQLAAAERSDVYMQSESRSESEFNSDSDNNNHPNNPNSYAHEEAHEQIALAHEEAMPDIPQDADSGVLLNKLQGLQQELSELRGQLEVQTHALQTLKKQQLDFYQDLDKRLREAPNTASNTTHANHTEAPITQTAMGDDQPSQTAPRGNPADEQIGYLAAYELVKNKEFDKAIMAMKSFIQQYPRGGYTANAHYWLGELYMVKQSFPDAIQQFETVLNTFPSSSKSSASSLKLGYAFAASGQTDAARKRLQAVIHDYPDTHAAQLASSKLENLKS